ncbi:MAG TPA: dienelactone hydrolase family protein, partial [Chroococcales cyanobacterium]
MDTVSEKLVVTAKDGGKFNCHVARPAGEATAAIVVIQEIFGITKWLQNTADWLAQNGFLAVVPDLFWRMEPGLQLDDRNEAQLNKAFGLYGRFDQDKGIEDLQAVVSAVRALPENKSGKVGVTGFCLGGLMTFMMAAGSDVDASVSYYGGGIDEKLDEAGKIKKPIVLHIPEEDKFITRDKQAKIKNKLGDNPLVTIYTYAGMDHAFCRVGGEHYDKTNAELANA